MTGTGGNNLLALSIALQACLFGLVCVILSLLNVNFGLLQASFVYLPVVVLFYWPLGAGYLSSLWAVAFIGLLQDLASGSNLGVWTLTYVILFILIDPTARKPRRGFALQWMSFSVLALSSVLLSSLLGTISVGQMPSFWNLARNFILLLLAFPIIYWIGLLFRQLSREL